MIPTILTLAFSLPRLTYAWPSKVLERKYEEVQPFYDYRKDNNQISTLTNLSYVEKEVRDILVYHGVLDNTALAVILGNIKQESNFNPLAYNSEEDALGLMQFRLDRKKYLERYCTDTTSVRCQLTYVFTEDDWKAIAADITAIGKDMNFYQSAMKRYLRYSHFGNRLIYAKEYLTILDK